jgi:hypothetical protein
MLLRSLVFARHYGPACLQGTAAGRCVSSNTFNARQPAVRQCRSLLPMALPLQGLQAPTDLIRPPTPRAW